jgi:hypothetical protein
MSQKVSKLASKKVNMIAPRLPPTPPNNGGGITASSCHEMAAQVKAVFYLFLICGN